MGSNRLNHDSSNMEMGTFEGINNIKIPVSQQPLFTTDSVDQLMASQQPAADFIMASGRNEGNQGQRYPMSQVSASWSGNYTNPPLPSSDFDNNVEFDEFVNADGAP